MMLRVLTLACLSSLNIASAQDWLYQEGDVDALVAAAKQAGRQSVVLFNFDGETG